MACSRANVTFFYILHDTSKAHGRQYYRHHHIILGVVVAVTIVMSVWQLRKVMARKEVIFAGERFSC